MKILISVIAISLLLSCSQNSLSDKEIKEYTLKGKEIGKTTVKKLGSNLMKNMKEGGPSQAIPFCNVAVNPLTEGVAKEYNVSIKRTSHKIRNEKNNPNEKEEEILNQYLASLSKGEKLKPIVSKGKDGKVHFYAPMKLEGKCMACHGTVGKEVTVKTDSLIKSLYPNDKATGFNVGDLRGIVNITFNSN